MQNLRIAFKKTVLSAALWSLWRSVAVQLSTSSSRHSPRLASSAVFLKAGIAISILFGFLSFVSAQETELLQDRELTMLARVVRIESSEVRQVPNTGTEAAYQTVRVLFLDGEQRGNEVSISDSAFLMEEGDKVYVRYLQTRDGTEYYSIHEPYRLDALLWLLGLFIAAALLFGGKQGFLSIIALFISFGGIFKFLFPEILTGGNVVIIATGGALLSLFVVMYMTHGFTRLTTSAFLGCTLSVIATVLLAKYAVSLTKLTGFASEESVYLNLATSGSLDFVALLVGGIIIGVIGVIDDVSITQASVVNQLRSANPSLPLRTLYAKGLKVGRDHMGAVINTLILAYAGASLPLVLLLYVSDTPMLELINRELIATEIVRSIVGSVGLLLAVPLTTLIAVFLMRKGDPVASHAHAH